ncbi:MAG TPA: helix-turn-helix domain-containing protein [Thermoplasmata archaeon]
MAGSSRTHSVRSTPPAAAPFVPPDDADTASEAPAGIEPLTLGLVHLGLSPREAQLYHTLLRFGPVTARHAIQTAHLDRATGYRVLSRLRVRGLVAATGNRPQQFVALEVGRLFERLAAFQRDDLELQRTVREIYQAELHQSRSNGAETTRTPLPTSDSPLSPPRPRVGSYRVLPRATEVGRFLVEGLAGVKEEFQALMRPQMIPEPLRSEVQQAIVRAVQRGVRVRIAVDYHPPEVEFLTGILKAWDGTPSAFEVRFYAPQFARLALFDHRMAMRGIGFPGSAGTGPEFGVASEDGEFVRYQTSRFQTVWRDALPMEQAAPTAGGIRFVPTASARELRHWVEHTHRSDYSRTVATAPWEYGPPRHPVLR